MFVTASDTLGSFLNESTPGMMASRGRSAMFVLKFESCCCPLPGGVMFWCIKLCWASRVVAWCCEIRWSLLLFDDAVPCGRNEWVHELVGAETNVSGWRLSSFSNLSASCWFDAWIWLRIESTGSLSWIGTRGCKSVGEDVVAVLTGCICWIKDPSCVRLKGSRHSLVHP